MKETTLIIKEKVQPKNAVLIEGLPGQGLVGKIAADFLAKQLKAEKIAELYSPHFAYYVLVDKKGAVRLLRSDLYYWENKQEENDLILLTGDSQPQTIEGQYEVAGAILDFAQKNNVSLILTIGGYRTNAKEKPQVLVSATSHKLLDKALKAGAKNSPPGSPIVGTAGLLIGLAKFRKIEAMCLLVETPGHLPDPQAAKSVLTVISKMLGIDFDVSRLDKDIQKSKQIKERMKRIEEQRRVSENRRRKIDEEKVTYIS